MSTISIIWNSATVATISLAIILLATAMLLYIVIQRIKELHSGQQNQQYEPRLLYGSQPTSVGISILFHNIKSVSQIEQLLSVEHDRYEVVAIIDRENQQSLFEQIVNTYHLLQVNLPYTTIFHANSPLRRLYRSAERRFRRILIIDAPHSLPIHKVLTEALRVTSYEYVIVLDRALSLSPIAIELAIINISDQQQEHSDITYIYKDIAYPIWRRERLISNGGFSPTNITHRKTMLNISKKCSVGCRL